MRKKRKWKEKT